MPSSIDLTKLVNFDPRKLVSELTLKAAATGDVTIKMSKGQSRELIKLLKLVSEK